MDSNSKCKPELLSSPEAFTQLKEAILDCKPFEIKFFDQHGQRVHYITYTTLPPDIKEEKDGSRWMRIE